MMILSLMGSRNLDKSPGYGKATRACPSCQRHCSPVFWQGMNAAIFLSTPLRIRELIRQRLAWLDRDTLFVIIFCLWIFKPAMSSIRLGGIMPLSHFLTIVLAGTVVLLFLNPDYLKKNRVPLALWFLFFLAVIASGLGRFDADFVITLALYAIFPLCLLAFTLMGNQRALDQQTYWAAMTLMAFVVIIGLGQSFFHPDPVYKKFLLAFVPPGAMAGGSYAASIFVNLVIFGAVCALLSVFCLTRIRRKNGIILNILHWSMACLAALGTWFSTSRNAILGLAVGLLGFLPLLGWKKALIGLALCLIAGSTLVWSGLPEKYLTGKPLRKYVQTKKTVSHIWNGDAQAKAKKPPENRLIIWSLGLKKWSEQPWTGIGLGQARIMLKEYKENYARFNMHNSMLTVLVECGLPALFVLAALMLWYLMRANAQDSLPVAMTLISLKSFDHYFDYSMAFTVFCAWIVAMSLERAPDVLSALNEAPNPSCAP
ncbi:MAG: O-antigen ligase family protein [Deltaproteobacteria bacterium]|nr:O-antigen ligase family protein [Deltaproteobacteria bacterium]